MNIPKMNRLSPVAVFDSSHLFFLVYWSILLAKNGPISWGFVWKILSYRPKSLGWSQGIAFRECRVGRLRARITKWTHRTWWLEKGKSWPKHLPLGKILGRPHAIFLPCNVVFALLFQNTLVQMESSIFPGKCGQLGGKFLAWQSISTRVFFYFIDVIPLVGH
jgi:hypothetical protein